MELDLTRDLHDLRVPGLSAAIVKRGEVVCRAVAGSADTDRDEPVTPRTIFTWASVSKTVTATALMQLFDRGLFALNDAVDEFLPFAVRVPACPRRPVTFRHLLTHTSGIRDSHIYESSYVEGDSPIPLGEFLEEYLTAGGRYYHAKQNFRSRCPGTVSEYSNIGAGLVGHLVEVLSGEPFDAYVADHVFTPLGMTDSSFRLSGLDLDLVARPGGTGPLLGFPTYPDGTLRSPPDQLAKFLIAYMQGGRFGSTEIISKSTVGKILKPQTPLDPAQGLMWYAERFGKKTLWGHNGDDPGISANMFFHQGSGTGVLLAANGEWKNDARRTMRKLLRYARER